MKSRMPALWRGLFVLAAGAAAAINVNGQADRMTADTFKGFEFRSIGPGLTTGRISDVAVDPKNPSVWYVAAASGNLWKTENRGNTWTPIFDDYGSFSLGAVVVDPEGLQHRLARHWREQQPAQRQLRRRHLQVDRCRQDVEAHGARELRAHPEHRDRPAQLERRLRDARSVRCGRAAATAASTRRPTAAQTWKAVLTIDADTGVTDIVMDPKKPDVLYAAMLQRAPRSRSAGRRRSGERPLQVDRRRRRSGRS